MVSPVLAGLLGAFLAPPAAPRAAVVTAVLEDQNGRPDSLAAHGGHPVLVLVVTVGRLRNLKGWELDLRQQAPQLDFLRVADVPADEKVEHAEVARRLREHVPSEVSVLIDIEGVWARALTLDTREVNLLLFDAQARLLRAFRGRREPSLVSEVAAAVRDAAR